MISPARVVVIGGGPAGMQAAITAKERGHDVVLFEKDEVLGGALRVASALPFKTDLKNYTEWIVRQTLESGVDVRLGVEARPDVVRTEKPDALIVAVGAQPIVPDILGCDKPHVMLAGDIDAGLITVGDMVVVIGAGLIGCETALHLAMQGKNVTIVDVIERNQIAEDSGFITKDALLRLLEDNGVSIVTETKVEAIGDASVAVIDKTWERQELSADTVVLATGYCPDSEHAESFQGLAQDVYIIGDCAAAENIMVAIHSAFNVASEL